MALRPSYPTEGRYMVFLVALTTPLYIFTGRKELALASRALFWSFLLLFFWRPVRIETGRITLEWGWPVVFIRREIPFSEIRDIFDLTSSERIRLINYFREIKLLAILWIAVGFMGMLKNAPHTSFVWVMWIYWGFLTLFMLSFTYRERWVLGIVIFALSLVMARYLYRAGQEGVGEYVAITGVSLALFSFAGLFTPKGVILVTENDTYILSSWDDYEASKFFKELGSFLVGMAGDKLTQIEGGASSAVD